MADADALKTTRATMKAQFTRSEKKLVESLNIQEEAQRVPITTIKRRFDDVVSKWSKAQDAHDAYIAVLGPTADLDAEDVWIQDISTRFDTLEITVDKYLEEVEKAAEAMKAPDPVVNAPANPTTTAVDRKLKFEIKLLPFCGDIRKYPEFKETFCKHVETEYSAEKHAFVLRNYLNESVRDEVSNVGDDYQKVWERLDQKYGDVGKLVDAILFQIKSLPPENAGSQCTSNMIKIVEKAYRDLERLNQESEMHNATTISMIEQRLPLNIRHEWVKLVASKKELKSADKFILLMELLTDWRCRLEYASDSIRVTPEQRDNVFYVSQQNSGAPPPNIQTSAKPGCWFHRSRQQAGDHPIWRCRDFQSRSVADRIQLVVLNKACQVCLVQNCPGVSTPSECVKAFTCNENGCGKSHNRLLHIDIPPPNNNAINNNITQQQQHNNNAINNNHSQHPAGLPGLPIQPL